MLSGRQPDSFWTHLARRIRYPMFAFSLLVFLGLAVVGFCDLLDPATVPDEPKSLHDLANMSGRGSGRSSPI